MSPSSRPILAVGAAVLAALFVGGCGSESGESIEQASSSGDRTSFESECVDKWNAVNGQIPGPFTGRQSYEAAHATDRELLVSVGVLADSADRSTGQCLITVAVGESANHYRESGSPDYPFQSDSSSLSLGDLDSTVKHWNAYMASDGTLSLDEDEASSRTDREASRERRSAERTESKAEKEQMERAEERKPVADCISRFNRLAPRAVMQELAQMDRASRLADIEWGEPKEYGALVQIDEDTCDVLVIQTKHQERENNSAQIVGTKQRLVKVSDDAVSIGEVEGVLFWARRADKYLKSPRLFVRPNGTLLINEDEF